MTYQIVADGSAAMDPGESVIILRCPSCRKHGTFEVLSVQDQWVQEQTNGDVFVVGHRRCPDPDCHALISFSRAAVPGMSIQETLTTHPPETIDFDTSDLPAAIVSALEEAITSHANRCYKAAAMMIRKSLEELCSDRGATGDNLKERIEALRDRIVLPADLFDGLDDLRLLGNDAAHIESRAYEGVGLNEVETGILFTKEVLKATYQYKGLKEKLAALKRQPTDSS